MTDLLFRLEYTRFEFLLIWWIDLTDIWRGFVFRCWYLSRYWKNPRFPEVWQRYCRRRDKCDSDLLKSLANGLGIRK